jgi:glycosyltransferase involved in cell wall biosynthesis
MADKVCVIIRVYNRLEDLKYCVSIIRDTWKSNYYFIIVAFNGAEDGYSIDDVTLGNIDLLVHVRNNVGHFSGNSQLLLAALPSIPKECAYTIILEADTWIYEDAIIKKYKALLEKQNAVWASAQFFRYVRNLATDFAIVKTAFILKEPDVWKFDKTPEYYVANYIFNKGYKYIYIKELMPVNLPRYIKRYPLASGGRFFSFPEGKTVTHHIETLKMGMDEKKFYFNVVAGRKYFDVPDIMSRDVTKHLLKLWMFLSVFIPYKGWFVREKEA